MQEIAIYTQSQPLTVKEYRGQRVITFKDVDTLHQRPEGTARRNFNANRSRFIEGEDFFTIELTADEIRRQFGADRTADEIRTQFGASKNAGRTLTVLTKMGYLMLVKSFTDDLAWMVQRQLVKNYFETHQEYQQPVAALPEVAKLVTVLTELEKLIAAPPEAEKVIAQPPKKLKHPTLRTLPNAVKELKEADPNSPISIRALRKLAKEKKIPVVMLGTRTQMVNMEVLQNYLYSKSSTENRQ